MTLLALVSLTMSALCVALCSWAIPRITRRGR